MVEVAMVAMTKEAAETEMEEEVVEVVAASSTEVPKGAQWVEVEVEEVADTVVETPIEITGTEKLLAWSNYEIIQNLKELNSGLRKLKGFKAI